VDDLATLHALLAGLDETSLGGERFRLTLNQFFSRAQKISAQIQPRFLEATLPLTDELRHITRKLTDSFHFLASGYQRVLTEAGQSPALGQHQQDAAHNAMECVGEQMKIAALIAAPVQPELWRTAHGLFIKARMGNSAEEHVKMAQTYHTLLALAVAQPKSLSVQQVAATLAYLSQFWRAVEVLDQPPDATDPGLFWLDPVRDLPPKTVARNAIPPGRAGLLYVSFTRLATLAARHIKALEQGINPATLKLPLEANEPAFLNLLNELRQHWGKPANRQFARRRNNYRVQACVGLSAVWHLLREDPAQDRDTPAVTEWMVMNESPMGYTLMHMSGHLDGLRHGTVIALRTLEQNWQICVVRWLTSESAEHVELGLQILAPGARPVSIAFDSEAGRKPLAYGLLLDPLPTQRPYPALFAPAGCSSASRFVLVADGASTQVSQGRRVSLDMQTASIELFQYEPDLSPL